MTADQYLHGILLREAVDAGPNSPLLGVQTTLMPTLRQWARNNLLGVYPSGSFMKGTAVRSGTDIDLFLSLSEHTSETLKEVYNKLFDCLTSAGYSPKRQNALSGDHSLYRRRADTWTKTNVLTHARTVIGAGRGNEIRILKLWRNQKGLDFPSFYLELSVIRALAERPLPGLVSYNAQPTLAQRVMMVFDYLVDSFPAARIANPANTHNIISEDLTAQEKAKVSAAAKAAREAAASSWEDIVR